MVKATPHAIPLIAACGDDSGGSFVLWQEESSPYHGTLRLQHLTASGDLSWPQEVVVCSTSNSRRSIEIFPDHLGGVYASWVEPSGVHAVPPSLVIARLEGADGGPAAGWPAAGHTFYIADTLAYATPQVVDDGAHGVFAAWLTPSNTVAAIHLGPDNACAAGWNVRCQLNLGPYVTGEELKIWPQIAPAGDGGAFVAWASMGFDGSPEPGHFRLRHVSASGDNVTPWPEEGMDFGRFDPALLIGSYAKVGSHLSLAPDGRGGAFLFAIEGDSACTIRLFRVAPDGQTPNDWPSGGKVVAQGCPGGLTAPSQSIKVFYNEFDGAATSRPQIFPCEGNIDTKIIFDKFSPDGSLPPAEGATVANATAVPFDQGSILVADSRTAEGGMLCNWSSLFVTELTGHPGWHDFYRLEQYRPQYGGIALAGVGISSAVLYWEQSDYSVPTGLLAMRFNGSGEVVSVPTRPSAPVAALDHVRFIAGVGAMVALHLAGGGEGSLELMDAQGRRLAGAEVRGSGEVTIPGTQHLRTGVYFVRLRTSQGAQGARLLVIQ